MNNNPKALINPGIKTKRVEASESGVMRDTDEGKDCIALAYDGPMFKRWAKHLTRGIAVRGKRNWMNASTQEDLERFRESAARHFLQWYEGETDEDHAAALFFNVNGAEYTREKLSDDPCASGRCVSVDCCQTGCGDEDCLGCSEGCASA